MTIPKCFLQSSYKIIYGRVPFDKITALLKSGTIIGTFLGIFSAEAYLASCQITVMEFFEKIVNE